MKLPMPEGDDLAEPVALSDGAGPAEDDLVVRADPAAARAGRVRPAIESEVDPGGHDCHETTVTADYGGSCPSAGRAPDLIPVRTMGR